MNIGIIGLPQVGKKTLFELITNHKLTDKEIVSNKLIKGVAEIRDPRFDKLLLIYKPKKEVRARIDINLLPKIEKNTIAKGDIFKDINELNAICHVVRAFKNDSVYHIDNSINPKRDIDFINSELILNDLIFIEKRLERIAKDNRLNKFEAALKDKEKILLLKLKAHLEENLPLRLLELSSEEEKLIPSYPFITKKELLVVLNVSDDELKDNTLIDQLNKEYESLGIRVMQVSVKLEKEISELDSEIQRKEFLETLSIKEPAIDTLTRICLDSLNLISFFTVGDDEVRQWTIRNGALAPEAAGVIHSDMEKGFIRSEVMKYEDLISCGNEEKVKAQGKFYLKGKDYKVEDGDILSIRFNI